MKNCVIIGNNSTADKDGSIIIGDDIHGLDRNQEGIMFIGSNVAIGRVLFGERLNLRDIIERMGPQ